MHAFVGAEIGPCKWCGVEHGASAAHFLQCTALTDLRVPFEEQIYQTFMSGAAKQMSKLDTPLTKQEVLQNILHVQPVEDQGPDEPDALPPTDNSSTASQPIPKKSRITCPRCQGDYALTKKGTPTQHTKKCNERVAAIEAANIAARAAAEAAASVSQGSAEAGVAPEDPGSPVRGTAYWKLQFHKNASIIAMYTGMFSAFTLAFLAGFIPQELSRKRVVRKIRELLLQRAHYAWWTQRELIAADSAKAPMTRSYIRRRKKLQTSTNAHNNPKKRRGEQANADQNLSQESAIRKRSKAVPPQETVAAIVIVVATTATKHQLQPGDNAQSAKRPKTVQALSEAPGPPGGLPQAMHNGEHHP